MTEKTLPEDVRQQVWEVFAAALDLDLVVNPGAGKPVHQAEFLNSFRAMTGHLEAVGAVYPSLPPDIQVNLRRLAEIVKEARCEVGIGDVAWAVRASEMAIIAREGLRLLQNLRPENRGLFAWMKSDQDSSLEQEAGQDAPNDGAASCGERELRAAASYAWVCTVRPDLVPASERGNKKYTEQMWNYIRENDCPAYKGANGGDLPVPGFATWKRYVRAGLSEAQTPRPTPRAGREHGGSIVNRDEI